MTRIALITTLCIIHGWGSWSQPPSRTFDVTVPGALTAGDHTKIERATYAGRPAVRIVEGAINSGGLAIINGATLSDGTIETALAARPAPGAREDARGFAGVAFRLQSDPLRYECFYLRPTNGRAEDQLRRNHSTQYISEPEFPWHRLRKEHPGVYESYVDIAPGIWTTLRIVVNGRKARLFVNGAEQPTLLVNDLKLPVESGGVALWIGQGTEAYFGPVSITPLESSPSASSVMP